MIRGDVDTAHDGVFPSGATRNGLPIKIVRANNFKGFRIQADTHITELNGLFTSMREAQLAVSRYVESSKGRTQEKEELRLKEVGKRKRGRAYTGDSEEPVQETN